MIEFVIEFIFYMTELCINDLTITLIKCLIFKVNFLFNVISKSNSDYEK